ncbi:MAG: response regulator transcription factor [Cyanobacteria bacterium SZAS LIN-2]|nr:response regulator transcription factor [Cyanobacteria bacterium SZAS LIN-2]
MAKILLVEDDQDLARMVIEGLTAEHHSVVHMGDGLDGLDMLKRSVYDVVILDWHLPGMEGIEILRKFRQGGGNTAVIMLTGRSGISEKEQGFSVGADDYLTKPFDIRELAVRIRALLRRPSTTASNTLKARNIELDPIKHTVVSNGKQIHISPRDFSLLEFLMRHPGEVFSVDALLSRVWNYDEDATPEALRSAVRRLRIALDEGKDPDHSCIENIVRVGYRLRD